MATVDIVHGELVSILDPPRYVPLCPVEGKTTKNWEMYKLQGVNESKLLEGVPE